MNPIYELPGYWSIEFDELYHLEYAVLANGVLQRRCATTEEAAEFIMARCTPIEVAKWFATHVDAQIAEGRTS